MKCHPLSCSWLIHSSLPSQWRSAHVNPKCLIKVLQLCSFYCKEWLGNALTPLCRVCAFQLLPRAGAGAMSGILPLITVSILLVMSCLYHPLPEITAPGWRWVEPRPESKPWTIPFWRAFVRRRTMVSPGSDHYWCPAPAWKIPCEESEVRKSLRTCLRGL